MKRFLTLLPLQIGVIQSNAQSLNNALGKWMNSTSLGIYNIHLNQRIMGDNSLTLFTADNHELACLKA